MQLEVLDLQARTELETLVLERGFRADASTKSSAATRKRPETHSKRTAFEHDRDRILYTDCFQKLPHRTQVFLLPRYPLLSNRMTHTIYVWQVARSIASYLRLNVALTEAIALGHDVGHVPFGHSGEPVLTELMCGLLNDSSYQFHHTTHALRVLNTLEREGKGVNLTTQVEDGILRHSKGPHKISHGGKALTLEGQAAMYADKIAYTFKDILDALQVGVVSESQLPSELWSFGKTWYRWIGTAIHEVVNCSLAAINDSEQPDEIVWHGEMCERFEYVKDWMYRNVYGEGDMKREFDKAEWLIRQVFDKVLAEDQGPDDESAAYRTLDRVAGMTDPEMMLYFNQNLVPTGRY
ncbi:HD domain-containing protein [Nanoarchaeota archaeon]